MRMHYLSCFIAWRYLCYQQKDSNIAVMIKICFLGILIGTFALMLTLIITNGFEKVIHEKLQGINAQIIISSPGHKLDFDGIAQAIKNDFSDVVIGISGNSIKQAIVDEQKNQAVLFLKGIYPSAESSVTSLPSKIVLPLSNSHMQLLENLLVGNQIIIGHKIAKELSLNVGQEITLLIPEPYSKKKLALKSHMAIVTGIFNIGLEEYDNNVAFTSLAFFNDLFDTQGVDQLTLKLAHATDAYEQTTIKRLQQRFPHLVIRSWKDMYPPLVASLKLEKYVSFFVLALITLVACMNMISLLFMQIQNKRRDIAIFKAMGFADKQIRSIFLQLGLLITTSASVMGLALAALAGYALERYPFIQLPDVYYVSYLPARMDVELFVVVFFATLVLGFLATWIPAHRATWINVTDVLRQE